MMETSPLTGERHEVGYQPITGWIYFDDSLGCWATQYDLIRFGGFNWTNPSLRLRDGFELTPDQSRKLLCFAASFVWAASKFGELPPYFIDQTVIERSPEFVERTRGHYQLISIQGLWRDAQQMTLDQKAERTLLNLAQSEGDIGDGVVLGVDLTKFPGKIHASTHDGVTNHRGLLYGCLGKEGLLVLNLLNEEGLVTFGPVGQLTSPTENDQQQTMAITPVYLSTKGYRRISELKGGYISKQARGFMVCRFNAEMDSMFDSCYKPVGLDPDVNCPVLRVKDVHHVDRIDDKIVRLINEATIVVVDLTGRNFNVAFEAGYALAANKPIVWATRFEGEDFRPPFDIQSENILQWKPEALDEFREALKFRMLAAVDKARIKLVSRG